MLVHWFKNMILLFNYFLIHFRNLFDFLQSKNVVENDSINMIYSMQTNLQIHEHLERLSHKL